MWGQGTEVWALIKDGGYPCPGGVTIRGARKAQTEESKPEQ